MKIIIIKIAVFLLVVWLPVFVIAQFGSDEYIIKAAMLEKFTRFVEWPQNTVESDSNKSFIIVVIGKNPFGQMLDDFYDEIKIKNKKVIIKTISSVDNIKDCHLLFICTSEKISLSKILERIKSKPILTVADTRGFAHKGVHINMYNTTDKIRFEINETAVRQSELTMSYLLLHAAKIINKSEE